MTEPEGQPSLDEQQSAEQVRAGLPRIYVASLSDYNAGRLHGTWIDATQDVADIGQQIAEMLARSPHAGAEEYAIHDYDNFGPLQIDEYDSIDRVAEIAAGIETHGEAFAHWAHHLGSSGWEDLGRFEEQYMGEWSSVEEFAGQLLADQGIDVDELGPQWLQPWVRFDLEGFARDLSLDFDISESSGGVFVFPA